MKIKSFGRVERQFKDIPVGCVFTFGGFWHMKVDMVPGAAVLLTAGTIGKFDDHFLCVPYPHATLNPEPESEITGALLT